MMSDVCGSRLFLSLVPDDVFIVLFDSLTPRYLCSISLCCTSLDTLVSSDKVWLSQCESLGIVNSQDLVEWRNGVTSYKCLCKFMFSVQPLLGIWVHQNPELGNVVYVMPGFLSVVGCRILPQELGPLGLEDGPLLWAPLVFFLHGQESDGEYFCPGSLKPVDRSCNVLSLEVEPIMQSNGCEWIHRSGGGGFSRSQRVSGSNSSAVAFNRLSFVDRWKLLELVTSQVGLKVPDSASGPLFPQLSDLDGLKKELLLLSERRLLLMQMYQHGGGYTDWQTMSGMPTDTRVQILGRSISTGGCVISKNGSSSTESKHAQLHEFLRSGDMIGLSLHASSTKKSTYRAWPNMHGNKYALYKLPTRTPSSGQEYAGLCGGTFGWPPGRPSEDKPGKALFFLLLSYEESEGKHLLIVDEPSTDLFQLETDGNSSTLDIKHAYTGEGIANGYGFRYPGSKPGSLFVIQDGLLAFVWKESRAVLTLQRINLQELLRKGERVPALPPIVNFTYLPKSYSNVFTSFSNPTNCFSSSR
ncbi:hypothetical protein MKW98_009256 [Papaver atlanticum]|uniref:F-box domain-containing protein n=1 Tax=Papaver atlanticum TaxID=357466 RepID=A0AAD4T323_9MAGN|nr:hypothetical protein MKW98_009256 [Papaver atlanticum]